MVIRVEALFVLLFLGFLTVMDLVTGAPWFQQIRATRLTYFTLVGVVLLAGLAVARKQWDLLRRFLFEWWPLVGTLAVYESLKHMHANRITEALGIPPLDRVMLAIDTRLFGKPLPLYFDAWTARWIVDSMIFFYMWVYYLMPVVLLGWAYFVLKDIALFRRLRRGVIVGLLGGYVLYLLVPVAGPLFLIGERFSHPSPIHPVLQNLVFDTLRYNWDCFPSLHTAIPWLLTALAWHGLSRLSRVLCIIASAGVTLSTLVLRAHWGIDLVAGLVWAGAVALFVLKTEHRSWSIALPHPIHRVLSTVSVPPLAWLGVLFAISGFVALIVEQCFEKMLQPVVGASGYSAATVLATYFLGLSLGGAIYGWWLRPRWQAHPARLYGILEGAVAFYALALFVGYDQLAALATPILRAGAGTFWTLQLARLAVAALWILPVTIVMGASFPAVADTVERSGSRQPDRLMTLFYAANLLGAVAAAVVAPYIVFPFHGIDGGLALAVILDVGVFLGVLHLERSIAVPKATALPDHADPFPFRRLLHGVSLVLGVVALFSGFFFFSLEVLWTHLVGAVLGTSVYSFSIMLAVVLLGLMIGALAVSLVVREGAPVSAGAPGVLLLCAAAVLALSHGSWPRIPHRLAMWGGALETFAQGELLRWIMALIQLLPASILMGAVFPLLFRLDIFPEEERGSAAGKLAAVNAVGCVLGALVTGYVLLGRIGSEGLSLLLAWGIALLGVLLFLISGGMKRSKGPLLLALVVVVLLASRPPWDHLALTSGEQVYFKRHQVFPQTRLLYFHEDLLGGMTTVVWNPAGVKGWNAPFLTLLTNGKFQGNDAWERDAQIGLALTPILFVPRTERALVIGLGTGQSAAVVDAAGFRSIDVAELAPGIMEAAGTYFKHVNREVLRRPNVRLHLEDGRNFLLLHPEQYDLVTMEISSVWFAGATNLYSLEFYDLVHRRLRWGGVFQQWIQLHHISPRELVTVLTTVRSVFPHVSLWVVGGQGVIVATDTEQLIGVPFASALPAIRTGMGWNTEETFERLGGILSNRLLDSEGLSRLVRESPLPPNTDRNRFLEYWTPRYNVGSINWPAINLRFLSRWASGEPVRCDPRAADALGPALRLAKPRFVRSTEE